MKEAVKGLRDLFNPSLEIRERGRSGGYKQFGELFVPDPENKRARKVWELGTFDKLSEIVQGP